MTKKSLIMLSIIFFILTISSYIFANNGLEGARDTVRNVVGGAENVVEKGVTGVVNSVKNAGNNDNQGQTQNNGNMGTNNDNNGNGGNTGYTATRTATTNTFTNGNTLMWIILAIVGIIIIGLVWYYANQYSDNNKTTNNH